MPNGLRLLLIFGSIIFFILLLKKIKKSKISVDMSAMWILLSLFIIFISIFPKLIIQLMGFIGIESSVNGVFLIFIFILLIFVFYLFQKVSILESKILSLTQRLGVNEYKKKR